MAGNHIKPRLPYNASESLPNVPQALARSGYTLSTTTRWYLHLHKTQYRGRKKRTTSVKKMHCPQHQEHSYFYSPLKKFDNEQYFLVYLRTCSKPTAFCAATQPEAESHAYCVYNNNISLQKGPDAILMHSMFLFVLRKIISCCCAPL